MPPDDTAQKPGAARCGYGMPIVAVTRLNSPKLQRIIYDEDRGLATYDPARMHSFEHVQDLGREEMAANPGTERWWLEEIAKGKGADVSVMLTRT